MNGSERLQWRCFTFVQRCLTFCKLTKTPYFNLEGWKFCLGANHTKVPHGDEPSPEQLNDEGTLEIGH